MSLLRGLYILDPESFELIYGPDERRDIAALVDVVAPPQTGRVALDNPSVLAGVDVIFSGWGGPRLDEAFLDAAPDLKAFFYAAGGLDVPPAVWERGVTVTRAIEANSIPVAEYTLAAILFSLKHGWRLLRETRAQRTFPERNAGVPGCYGSTVGLVSLGFVARALLPLLRPFDLKVLAYDPHVSDREARQLGVERVSLDELFRRSDVVSLHAPVVPGTVGMITGAHVDSMRRGATLINTARGEVVREAEVTEALSRRPDLQAVLDVAEQEPPAPDSPLYALENVVLTPHIAGSAGDECRRMGRYMVEELRRYLAGEPLKWEVRPPAGAGPFRRPAAGPDHSRAAAGVPVTNETPFAVGGVKS